MYQLTKLKGFDLYLSQDLKIILTPKGYLPKDCRTVKSANKIFREKA